MNDIQLTVGIPTLVRYDLLTEGIRRLLSGALVPAEIIVIDNGGGFECSEHRVRVIRPGKNIGVAASWNRLRRECSTELAILNDDIWVMRDTLARLADCEAPFVAVSDDASFVDRARDPGILVSNWSCFLQRREVWDTVGPYDEAFWPAYGEDADYDYRLRLNGLSVTQLPTCGMWHAGSATVKSLPQEQLPEIRRLIDSNEEYFVRKWGGPPGQERFTTPFNGDRAARQPSALESNLS